jgi:hypothetical protein
MARYERTRTPKGVLRTSLFTFMARSLPALDALKAWREKSSYTASDDWVFASGHFRERYLNPQLLWGSRGWLLQAVKARGVMELPLIW